MSRQPTAPVGVRFYYLPTDENDLRGSLPSLSLPDGLFPFKIDNSNLPLATTGIQASQFHQYNLSATAASTTKWTSGNWYGIKYVETQVNSFSGGSIGASPNGNGAYLPTENANATSNIPLVFPNPTAHSFTLDKDANIVITDVLGRVIFKNMHYSAQTSIELPIAGCYFLQCLNENGTIQNVQKIICE